MMVNFTGKCNKFWTTPIPEGSRNHMCGLDKNHEGLCICGIPGCGMVRR